MAFQFSTGVGYGYQESRESITDRRCRNAMEQIQQKAEFCLFSVCFYVSNKSDASWNIVQ